jgi:uncharacterized membrane protein YphA (DoxX/SURF4 family)
MDGIMRFLTHPALRAAVSTNGAPWIAPTRIALGVLLLVPVDADIRQLLAVHRADPSAWLFTTAAIGTILRALEILSGISFVVGFGIRLAAWPALVLLVVRALANCASSFPWLRDVVSGVIVPHGDWGSGAMYLGVALLLGELLGAGSGRWSVDYWLSQKLRAGEKGDARRD